MWFSSDFCLFVCLYLFIFVIVEDAHLTSHLLIKHQNCFLHAHPTIPGSSILWWCVWWWWCVGGWVVVVVGAV